MKFNKPLSIIIALAIATQALASAQRTIDADVLKSNSGVVSVPSDLNLGASNSVRVKNTNAFISRNAADTLDVPLIYLDAFNRTTINNTAGSNILLNNNFIPAANETYSFGVDGDAFLSGVVALLEIYQGANRGQIDAVSNDPSGQGASTGVVFKTNDSARNLYLFTLSGTASKDVYVETGNASAGNSGNLIYRTGTASGTRGKLTFKDGTEGTAGYVWTSTDTTGKGAWVAPSSGTGVPFDFGDGSDGDAVLDGSNTFAWADLSGSTYTLNRQVYLHDLTINSGITLISAQASIFGTGTLHIISGGIIDQTGGDGGPGSGGGVGGAASIVATSSPPYGFDLGTGGPGGGTSPTPLNTVALSGIGGGQAYVSPNAFTAGSGGGSGGGSFDNTDSASTGNQGPSYTIRFVKLTNLLATAVTTAPVTPFSGGSGGASGGSGGGDLVNVGGYGGGGGGGGGVMGIWFHTLNNQGTIRSNGGAGGVGETPSVGNTGGGGGGGGGAGGFVYIVDHTTTNSGTIQVNGGSGGAAGSGFGTGNNGIAGGSGQAGTILHYETSTGTWL